MRDIIGLRREVEAPSALTVLVLRKGAFFLCDTHVTVEPTAEGIAEMTLIAAEAMRRFGIEPKAALLSHSSFGASDEPSARKMRAALALVLAAHPDFEIEGEMQAELAVSPSYASVCSLIPGLPGRPIFWSCPPWTRRISPWASCASWGRGCPSGRS